MTSYTLLPLTSQCHRITLRRTASFANHHATHRPHHAWTITNQSRISSFICPAPTAAAYQAQLQRDHDEQSVTAERFAIQKTEQQERMRRRKWILMFAWQWLWRTGQS